MLPNYSVFISVGSLKTTEVFWSVTVLENTCGHNFKDARVLLVSNDVLACAVEGSVVLVVGGGKVEGGNFARSGSEPLLVQLLLVVRVVEVPRECQHRRVGVQLRGET